MRPTPALLFSLALLPALLTGCTDAGPARPEGPTEGAPATTSPAVATPATSPPVSSSPVPSTSTPPPPPPPQEPIRLADDNRTFEMRAKAREASEVVLLVNATDRVLVRLDVRNVQPAARGFGVNVLASGPNGTRASDSGQLPDGGASFTLRLSPLGLGPEDGPALLRVRLSATVAAEATGRVFADDEVPREGGSTVPGD